MELNEIYSQLCCYDKRNPDYLQDDDFDWVPRDNCFCDNCFYGRDKLALYIIKIKKDMTKGMVSQTVESLEYDFVLIKGLKETRDEMKNAIKEVLEVVDGYGVPNVEWIKNRLTEGLKHES